ncbi:glycosyltransferase [Pseudomonadota bacterium]
MVGKGGHRHGVGAACFTGHAPFPFPTERVFKIELKICHLIPYLGLSQGGPVYSLAALAESLLEKQCQVTVASMPRKEDGPQISLSPGIELAVNKKSFAGSFRWAPGLVSRLQNGNFSVVHSHGLWTYASMAGASLARRLSIPHLLAPCGMLQPKALRISNFKKKLAGLVFQNSVLENAHCLHAKSEAEYQSFREYGLTNPIAIIPNPLPVAPMILEAEITRFRKKHQIPDGEKQLLFLGRLHPVKGLERLLMAWSELGAACHGWGLLLAGPDEGGYRSHVEMMSIELKLGPSVRFTGPLSNQEKWVAFGASSLFIMPSDFENFGSAVAEALLAGVPVITTTGTPWKIISEQGCGWYVEANVPAVRAALLQAIGATDVALAAMGKVGVQIAREYSTENVTERVIGVYHWLLGQHPQPNCVVND